MLSSYPFWWFALPVLLLPIWLHRQKRQRIKAELLATARFLPSAAPEQLRIWRWRDRILLLLRCLLLVALIAWLAAIVFPWRGDTVLLDAAADQAWAEQQIQAAGFGSAQRMPLPEHALQWIRLHERDWRPSARLLIVAGAEQVAMPARLPQFGHALELRLKPGAAKPAAPLEHRVAVAAAPARMAAWRALFAAFEVAGKGGERYVLASEPDAKTELIVWDMPDAAPPAAWRAPLWWVAAGALPELASAPQLSINGLALKYADSPRGRLWASSAWPPQSADSARAFYQSWQALIRPAPVYGASSQSFGAARSAPPPIADAAPPSWLAYLLLALFLLERILTHARRN